MNSCVCLSSLDLVFFEPRLVYMGVSGVNVKNFIYLKIQNFQINRLQNFKNYILNWFDINRIQNLIMKKYAFILLLLLSFSAFSQSSILLEACNKIEIQSDRLSCFKEIYKATAHAPDLPDKQQLAIDSVKKEFAELQQIIKTGISYKAYSDLMVKPAMKLGSLKVELNGGMPYMIRSLEEAVIAYNDAKTVWHASIYDSMDGGIFVGKILNPERSGLIEIVKKYNLPLESKLLQPHLPATTAIMKIFDYAEGKTKDAFAVEAVAIDAKKSEDLLNKKDYFDPFRKIDPLGEKCRDKFDVFYDPVACRKNGEQ